MNKLLKLLFLSLFTAATLTSCSEDPEVSVGSITGNVVNNMTDYVGVPGVSVSFNGQSTFTDEAGYFEFFDVQPGNYTLQFTKSGYNTATKAVNVVAGQDTRVYVQMQPTAQEAKITINPTSINFGTTQTEMSVTITNNGNATAEWVLDYSANWLSASMNAGSIQAGRTQSITFYADRNFLSGQATTIVNLQAFGNSYPISVSCSPVNATSGLLVEPSSINFGSDLTSATLNLRNISKNPISWTTTGTVHPAITLSPSQGTISAGANAVVIVSLDRSLIEGSFLTTLVLTDGISEQPVIISANTAGQGGDIPGSGDSGNLVVTNGLTAYYRFNDTFDDINGIYDGFGINDPAFVTGVSGKAVQFSKVHESADNIPYGFFNNKTFSMSFWIKDVTDGLIYYSKCSDNNNRFVLSMKGGYLKFICTKYNNNYQYDNTETLFTHSSISDSKWHHVVITSDYNSTTAYSWTSILYIDGKKVSTITEYSGTNQGETDYPNAFVIAGKTDMDRFYSLTCSNFSMDNLRVYDSRILTPTEIKEIYNAQQ